MSLYLPNIPLLLGKVSSSFIHSTNFGDSQILTIRARIFSSGDINHYFSSKCIQSLVSPQKSIQNFSHTSRTIRRVRIIPELNFHTNHYVDPLDWKNREITALSMLSKHMQAVKRYVKSLIER